MFVALSETDKKAVVGECKFKNEKIDKGIYETLIRRGKLINAKYEVTKYSFLFVVWIYGLVCGIGG